MTNLKLFLSVVSAVFLLSTPSFAQDVWITDDTPFVELELNGDFLVIERNPDNDATISATFAKTSRPCPPFCVHPMVIAEGVETYGELELIAFLENEAQAGAGMLIDARISGFYADGTIPGSINLPFNLLSAEASNPFLSPILQQLGASQQGDDGWSFDNALTLVLFCNGSWCDQSPQAINSLLSAGYPAEKLKYYRGGMQSWLMLGLTMVVPET